LFKHQRLNTLRSPSIRKMGQSGLDAPYPDALDAVMDHASQSMVHNSV